MKKILGLDRRISRLLFGVEDLELVSGKIVSCGDGGCTAKGFLLLKEFAEVPEDLSGAEVQRILSSYIKILSQNSPAGVRAVVYPVDVSQLLSKIDRQLQVKLIMLESDPTNERLRTDIERLRILKRRILGGEVPFNVHMVFEVQASGADVGEALKRLRLKISSMREELKSIGIYVEEVGGAEILGILDRFFRKNQGAGGEAGGGHLIEGG